MHGRWRPFSLAFVLLLSVSWLVLSIFPVSASAQSGVIWRDIPDRQIPTRGERRIVPRKYRPLEANLAGLMARLAQAPVERAGDARISQIQLELPLPDGTNGRFRIAQSPIMEPALAAKFPDITTFIAHGIDDPSATARLDRTPSGFHAMILSDAGTFFIDPYSTENDVHYLSYWKRDYPKPADKHFEELEVDDQLAPLLMPETTATAERSAGGTIRTYRLAVAATGEYTAFSGGTTTSALAAITTTVNRVNAVYERELGIRMKLVANNDVIIYTNPSTDPYSNNDGGLMLSQNQTTIDSRIGNANYDIGHVFSTGGGGVATLGCPCVSGSKARGVTGSSRPVGDAFDVDYVAHEMGHQFGAIHTFNGTTNSCGGGNRTANSAYEPNSGSTIMAYAGICGVENLQPNSDDYFHSASFDEIQTYITTGNGRLCGTLLTSSNTAPTANAGLDYTIPAQTAFQLTGSATDSNNDALSYTWEQYNLGTASPPNTDNGSRPLFRSYKGTSNPVRVFPRMSDILNNVSSLGEVLPTTNRTLAFRLTVRDNRSDGGGVHYDTMNVSVAASTGPFRVTSPNDAVTWSSGSTQTITWDVANTNTAPVNCASVDILLSTDGGATWGTALANGTPNDGAETITVPNVNSEQVRIMVRCSGNIFFDVGNAPFKISSATSPTETPTSTPTAVPTQTTVPSSTPLPSATPSPTPIVVSNPTSLTANALSSARIQLRWSDGSANEQGFEIERSTNGTSFTRIAITAANATGYTNTGLTAGNTYYYRVRAYNGTTFSTYSNTASAKARR